MNILARLSKQQLALLEGIACIVLLIAFIYFRTLPILNGAVPYTYDQGRDFLKAYEIVKEHHPTFLGPTTGIMGVYHGAWWYYVLSIPFLLIHGNPYGFYFFNLLVQTVTAIVFFLFVRKYFGAINAYIAALLITTSGYFIGASQFVGNNTMVLPVIAGLIMTTTYLLTTDKPPTWMFVLNGLLLGLMFEFEVAFGIFIIPSYILAAVIIKKSRSTFFHFLPLALTALGIVTAWIMRIFFELRHGFLQTKTIISFLFKPKLYNPHPFNEIIRDRITMFKDFYVGIFPSLFIAAIITIVAIGLFTYVKRKDKVEHKPLLLFFSVLAFFLFFLSLFYKDSFWINYYEGLPYLLLTLFILVLANIKDSVSVIFKYLIIAILIIQSLFILNKNMHAHFSDDGLKVQSAVVKYIVDNEPKQTPFCVRIYTPPVIPHTYNYLFKYENMAHGWDIPKDDWVNNSCWFIIEPDSYAFRRDEWVKNNIPKTAPKKQMKIYNIDVVLYDKQ